MPCTLCARPSAKPRSLTIAEHTLTTPLCPDCAEVVSSTLSIVRVWRETRRQATPTREMEATS